MNRRSTLALAAAALTVALGTLTPPATASTPATTTAAVRSRLRFFDLPARDGVKLKANVVEPSGPGRHPAIVFPASWAANDFEYLLQAFKLAERGYVVLSFTPRGLFGSGGEIDVAGPKDLSDISAAYDWLIANSTADPARLGVAGVSYGGDMALEMAAYDKRTKAVGGLSAFADLRESLYPNKTRVSLTVPLLWGVGRILGRPSAEFTEMMNIFQKAEHESDPATQKVLAFADVRSASRRATEINKNGTAVFLANGWGDSFFPPNQFVAFFNRLTVPNKHLEFAPGDHATSEATGLAGLPNPVWDSFTRFFDKNLAGRTGVPQDAPVVLTPRVNKPGLQDPFNPGKREPYGSWSTIAPRAERYALGAGERLVPAGGGGARAEAGTGSTTIQGGGETKADSGLHFLTNAIDQVTGIAPTVKLSEIARKDGAVWQTAPLGSGVAGRSGAGGGAGDGSGAGRNAGGSGAGGSGTGGSGTGNGSSSGADGSGDGSGAGGSSSAGGGDRAGGDGGSGGGGVQRLRGEVRLRTNVTTTAPTNSFFSYLYDVDARGTGRLITYAPYTLRDVKTGVPLPIDLKLQSTGYDLPAGHRLALVIDTKDFRYMDAGKAGSTLTFSGPSSLDLPLGSNS
ncbi:prolyl oligopeptidase family serine peptidase [Actinomadura barringtoniae]|uniref:Prolyl oligopeptidase family serine peptidase n=1 Tax=Actinomadura barringtoniae TaxID=1427535 RepID=A0A939PQU3_9ACTN|nr:CocE/NonD family hydrolase [Actinomadura barringtoniae]MBO2453484.1 prolyl oligopeptidase family serine peptidase [Actinomadura barringtoniae]